MVFSTKRIRLAQHVGQENEQLRFFNDSYIANETISAK